MNKASNANAPAMSPSPSDEERSLSLALSLAPTQAAAPTPAPSGVTEHAPPTVLVTVGLASSAVGRAADSVSSVTSPAAVARTEPARDPVEPGDGEPPYSADEAAWLFGLERVAPVPSSQLPQESEPSSSSLSAQAASAPVAVSHAEPVPMATPLPMPVPMAQDEHSQTSALSAEITAALLPAPDLANPANLANLANLAGLSAQPAPASSEQPAREPSEVAPAVAAVAAGGEAALPLAARQTLHLQQLPTPFHAGHGHGPGDVNTPPHGHAGFAVADPDAGAPTVPGVPRDSETTASLQLPATLPQQLRLPRASEAAGPPTRPGEASLVRRAADSLLANLGMGLLGGLLALLGAVGFLYLRGDGAARPSTQPAAPPQATSVRPDQAARTRLLEQVTQSLLAGRRHQAVASLREYAALSPEPAIEELIRILEREP